MAVPGGTFANVILPSDKPPFNEQPRAGGPQVRRRSPEDAGGHPRLARRARQRPPRLLRVHVLFAAAPAHSGPRQGKSLPARGRARGGISFKISVRPRPPSASRWPSSSKRWRSRQASTSTSRSSRTIAILAHVWNKACPTIGFYATRPTADTILISSTIPRTGSTRGAGRRRTRGGREDARQSRARRSTVAHRRRLYAQFQKVRAGRRPFNHPFFRSELSASGPTCGIPAEREQLRDGSRGGLAHRRRARGKKA